jgi:TolB-like protein
MKTRFNLLLLIVIGMLANNINAYAQKESITVFNFDTQNIGLTPEQMGNIARIELEKLDTFEVMDRYDVSYLIKKQNLDVNECYGKLCLVEVGKKIKTDKILTGSVEIYSKSIIISLRLIDVNKGIIENTHVEEYLNLPEEVQTMLSLSLRKVFGLEYDILLNERLTKKSQFYSGVTAQDKNSLRLNGPRLGTVIFVGSSADDLTKSTAKGGLDAYPAMFMFGYQFEIQYINQGNFQALFEIVPAITGLDQSYVIPSISILNGLRHNVKGWEFAMGPVISLTRKAKGYYDEYGNWNLSNDWAGDYPNPNEQVTQFDSRGDYTIETGFIFAVGKSFKSGKLNIPINAYIVPKKDGGRIGVTFGYNANKNNKF